MYMVCFLIRGGVGAAVPRARVIKVIDSHTISVEVEGRRSSVALSGVAVPPAEEAAALEHLHRLVDGTWVYGQEGNVYPSPERLFLNCDMQRHAWRSSPNMPYPGLADPGPRTAAGTTEAVQPPSPCRARAPS